MGLLRGLMGHASEVDIEKVERDLEAILIPGEEVDRAYRVIRDLFVFTNKRLILIDKQGMTGKKTEYFSIPYRSITYFSVESSGHFDLDAELKIWIRGMATPIQKEFRKDKNIYDVQKTLARHIL